ncbi:hypothetical protein BKA82DRAFT_452756 [Pisolithus tinctorius]|uniref:Uncharacterized protein n=1 Tax=Pisolithus tinctorius Marx 270 TaxID=870435 RepID=A0A0C3PIL6_PISTI|nr:hypothetical protein BKA82DRAFT_452756 [Pisolithus tinctorius]KIO13965.1 hypothetical protein M404DRAFT_452756 [Pisolithus tinctorius Marx 270]
MMNVGRSAVGNPGDEINTISKDVHSSGVMKYVTVFPRMNSGKSRKRFVSCGVMLLIFTVGNLPSEQLLDYPRHDIVRKSITSP